jgi:hypothetical protein
MTEQIKHPDRMHRTGSRGGNRNQNLIMFRPILIGRRFRSFAVLQVLVEFYDLLAWAVDQQELVECVILACAVWVVGVSLTGEERTSGWSDQIDAPDPKET